MTENTPSFWKSIMQDEQLQQLDAQLHEVDAQLASMKASLNSIPMMIQITKAIEIKVLHNRASKAGEMHKRHTTQLDKFQELDEELDLKSMDALGHIQESHTQDVENIVDHSADQDVEECATITTQVKEAST